MGTKTYSGTKAVCIGQYDIEGKTNHSISVGEAVDLGTCYHYSSGITAFSPEYIMVNTEVNFVNGVNKAIKFADVDEYGRNVNDFKRKSLSLADGMNFVIKPLLHLDKGSSVGAVAAFSMTIFLQVRIKGLF